MRTKIGDISSELTKKALIILCLILLLSNSRLSGQVTIAIPTGSFQYSLQDLSQTSIDNLTGQTISNCYFEITCNDATGNKVFDMRTPNTNIIAGNSFIGYAAITGAQITGGGQTFTVLQQTGIFPAGNYTVCMTAYTNGGSKILGTGCSAIVTSDFGNLYLLSPQDEAIIETEYPTLEWMTFNSRKLDASVKYSIRVCLLQADQNYGEAIVENPPLVYQQNLNSNSFTYPTSAPLLDTSQKYVWQVGATITIGNSVQKELYSEIWMFQFGKHPPTDHKKKKKEEKKEYAYLTKRLSGALYVFDNYINFRYNNEGRDSLLSYNVYEAGQRSPVFTNKEFPVVLKPRVNYISLAVPKAMTLGNKSGKSGSTPQYTLAVRNSRKEDLELKFSIINKKKKKN